MGDRISIQFSNGSDKSPILFSHWDGMELVGHVNNYLALRVDQNVPNSPLARLEPGVVMVDFLRYFMEIKDLESVTDNYYLVCRECEGDNSDNGHHIFDLATYTPPSAMRTSWVPLSHTVLIVAVPGNFNDWSAYIDTVPGRDHGTEYTTVARYGSKVPEEVARIYFPQFSALKYRN